MREAASALARFYGPLAAPPRDLFALFVWEVISTRTLPARRDIAWQALKRLPALTPDAMFRASKDDLKTAIEGLGAFEERFDALKHGAGHFRRQRDVPERVASGLRPALRALADVPSFTPAGRLRALYFAGGYAVPAVDDGVARAVTRFAGIAAKPGAPRRRAARRYLTAAFAGDRDQLTPALVLLAHHATQCCVDQAPHCGVCPLKASCATPAATVVS
jgi:endonuclease III